MGLIPALCSDTIPQNPLGSASTEISGQVSSLTAGLTYSTYFGGSASEEYIWTATDSAGNVWVAGGTTSTDLPTTTDAYNKTNSGSYDIFVVKLDGDNGSLLYSTYIGGSGYELPMAIKVDTWDNVWICGETGSGDFPTTPDAFNSTLNGAVDMFILKLSGNNGSLLYSSYIGGSGVESALSMDIDSEGNAWATGITTSSDFPLVQSSLYKVYNGSNDAILFELSENGTTLLYSTYIGGTADDRGYKVLVDAADNVWVAGTTGSANFPVTPDAYKNTISGSTDIYLLKMSHDGSSILYSTYFGGSQYDTVASIAFDSDGNIWGTGATSSSYFPTTTNAYDSSYAGNYDCVVFQFSKNGSALLYSTYLGGINEDQGYSISVDRNNAVWIAGDTGSSTFPTTVDAFNRTLSGVSDAFLLSLAPNGTTLYYSTFLGGSDSESFPSSALGPSGQVWITGETQSTNFPTTDDAYNTSASGSNDLFMTRFTIYSAPDSPVNLSATESMDQNVVLLWERPAFDGNSEVTGYRVYRNTTAGSFDVPLGETTYEYFVDTSVLPGLTYHYVVTSLNKYGESLASTEANITVIVPTYTPGAPQNLSATPMDSHIYLNWSAPLDDGGSQISVYHIYRRTSTGFYTELVSTLSTHFNDTTVTAGALYYYQVAAENSVGEGIRSIETAAKIPDTIVPTINHPSDISYNEGSVGHSIIWMPADANPAFFSITRNGTVLISGAWAGGNITLNVDYLSEGSYAFNCTVVDQAGNQASDMVTVSVTGLEPTTSTTTSTETTTSSANGPGFPITTLIVGFGIVVIAIVAVLVVARKQFS
jgi:fibronectin type 3 domain-containing protein